MYYNNDTILCLNGAFVKAVEAHTDLYSQSLHYGYAVFEGIRAYQINGKATLFKAEAHYDRLRRSAAVMKIPFDYTNDRLIELTYGVLERNGFTDAYIRPLVYCSPNMSLSKGREAYLAIQAWEWTNGYLANKMRVMTSSYQRPHPGAFHIHAKVSGHYVNSILACQEAKDAGYDEALLTDQEEHVAEGPGANVFMEKDGVLYTPPSTYILPGITRATVLELCQQLHIPVIETPFTPEDMRGANAAFFCGTAAEVVELAELDGIPFTLPWSETQSCRIQMAYKATVLHQPITTIQQQFV
jgi:branched-chain amino acid aminotransferase